MRGAAVLALVALVALAACKSAVSHIYMGEQWDPAKNCVQPQSSVDVVDGESASATCSPTCLVAPADQDGGRTIYVSTMCAPLPALFDATGTFPGCDRALAAFARGDVCLPDGGTSNPAPDAGGD
jgi:hypothetical protein